MLEDNIKIDLRNQCMIVMNDSIVLIFLRKSLSKHLFTHDYDDYDDEDLLFK
jgi:hypothetical protein